MATERIKVSEALMSLRDYFAAKALAALILKVPLCEHESRDEKNSCPVPAGLAHSAYQYADVMLEERNK